jgi:two-component system response regulator FixJ
LSQVNIGWAKLYYPARMTDARPTPTHDRDPGLPPRKPLICVIDDDFDVLKSLRFLLETEGFDVRTFRNGSALLGSQSRREADCLVVDYKMAGIDGIELAHRLHSLDISTPVILITGYPDENIAAKARSAGVHQVLFKPLLDDSLVATVRNAINSGFSDCA